jgi:hypothetical protein
VIKMKTPVKIVPGLSADPASRLASKKQTATIVRTQLVSAEKEVFHPATFKDTLPVKTEEEELSGFRENIPNVISDLISAHVVASRAELRSFALDLNILEVNDERQPEWMHQKFLEKYGIRKDLGWYYGPEKATGRGFFIADGKTDSAGFVKHAEVASSSRYRFINDSLKVQALQKRFGEFQYKKSLSGEDYAESRKQRPPHSAYMMYESKTYNKLDPIIGKIIGELILAGAIPKNELVSFNLCNKELRVNGLVQPESLHRRLLEKYVVPWYRIADNAQTDPDFGVHLDMPTRSSGLGFYRHAEGPL